MEIISKYHELSIGIQVQILFTASSVMLISALMVISNYQINWVQDKLDVGSKIVVVSNLQDEMIDLVKLNSQFIENEFSSYLALATYLSNSGSQLCNQTFPLEPGTPIFNLTESKAQNKGMFYSNSPISALGSSLATQESSFDYIFPYLLNSHLLQFYIGYELDHIFHIYPSTQMPENYNPTVREWYYTAKNSLTSVFTEPYIDASKKIWVISASCSIYCKNKFRGVAALDVTLKSITERLEALKLFNNTFFLLVSKTGSIINMPSGWKGESARMNDTVVTGFPADLWLDVLDKDLPVEKKFEFQDQNNLNLFCFRNFIQPKKSPSVTHYLFVCASDSELAVQVEKLEAVRRGINYKLFWIVFSIGSAVFITIMLIVCAISNKINKELRVILKAASEIYKKALFPNNLANITLSPSELKSSIFGLIALGVKKMKSLKYLEKLSIHYRWGPTRPADSYIFNSWQEKRYPLNYYNTTHFLSNSYF